MFNPRFFSGVVYLRRYKVRFVALVGASIVHIQPSSLRHCANAGEIVRGSFRVVHGTSLLQAQIELRYPKFKPN